MQDKQIEAVTPEQANELREKTAKKKAVFVRYVVAISVAVAFFVIIGLIVGLFEGPKENVTTDVWFKWLLTKLVDVFFIDGAIFVCVGGLMFCDRHGAYDTIAYGVREAIGVMFRSPEKRKYKDLYEYKKAKDANRPEFRYLLWIGLALLVPAIVSLILTYVL